MNRRFATALVAVLFVACAIGLLVWQSSGPSVYASGHRWALYPSTGEIPEPDSSSHQERLAFDGNVKLLSLLYIEHLKDEQGEQIRDALCHVLIDLPPDAILRITGGGSDADAFIYRDAKVIIQEQGKEPPLETAMKLRYRLSDRRLAISIGGEEFEVQTGNETGNVFLVRIDGNGKADGFVRTGEQIPNQIDAEDVKRLMKQTDAGK